MSFSIDTKYDQKYPQVKTASKVTAHKFKTVQQQTRRGRKRSQRKRNRRKRQKQQETKGENGKRNIAHTRAYVNCLVALAQKDSKKRRDGNKTGKNEAGENGTGANDRSQRKPKKNMGKERYRTYNVSSLVVLPQDSGKGSYANKTSENEAGENGTGENDRSKRKAKKKMDKKVAHTSTDMSSLVVVPGITKDSRKGRGADKTRTKTKPVKTEPAQTTEARGNQKRTWEKEGIEHTNVYNVSSLVVLPQDSGKGRDANKTGENEAGENGTGANDRSNRKSKKKMEKGRYRTYKCIQCKFSCSATTRFRKRKGRKQDR